MRKAESFSSEFFCWNFSHLHRKPQTAPCRTVQLLFGCRAFTIQVIQTAFFLLQCAIMSCNLDLSNISSMCFISFHLEQRWCFTATVISMFYNTGRLGEDIWQYASWKGKRVLWDLAGSQDWEFAVVYVSISSLLGGCRALLAGTSRDVSHDPKGLPCF